MSSFDIESQETVTETQRIQHNPTITKAIIICSLGFLTFIAFTIINKGDCLLCNNDGKLRKNAINVNQRAILSSAKVDVDKSFNYYAYGNALIQAGNFKFFTISSKSDEENFEAVMAWRDLSQGQAIVGIGVDEGIIDKELGAGIVEIDADKMSVHYIERLDEPIIATQYITIPHSQYYDTWFNAEAISIGVNGNSYQNSTRFGNVMATSVLAAIEQTKTLRNIPITANKIGIYQTGLLREEYLERHQKRLAIFK